MITLNVNRIDHLLISLINEEYTQFTSFKTSFSRKDLTDLILKFRENKISLEKISKIISNSEVEGTQPIMKEIYKDETLRRQWLESIKMISQLFSENDVKHVYIKMLNLPWALMTDLDVLPLNPEEELKALEILHKLGFNLFQFRLLAHPLKIMATKTGQEISIDFYPEPMWIRKKVCDTEIIFARKRAGSVNGVEIPLPSLEDDLYLVGTHAYDHLNFTLAEILHGINLLSKNGNFDWDYLYHLAIDYGTVDAIYTYIKSIDLYSKLFHKKSIIDEEILMKFQKNKICEKIGLWFKNKYMKNISFPIRIPTKIACIHSSFYHCRTILGRMPLSELAYDFLSHYLTLSSKTFLGKT